MVKFRPLSGAKVTNRKEAALTGIDEQKNCSVPRSEGEETS